MTTITLGFGAEAQEVRIPDWWTVFQFQGRIYERRPDGSFAFVRRVGAKVPQTERRDFAAKSA